MAPDKIRENVYISDQYDAERYGGEFDHVITLTRDDGPTEGVGSHEHTDVHMPLYDSGETSYIALQNAIDKAVSLIAEDDGYVLVHCNAGISRSATVIIAALAIIDGSSWHDTFTEVKNARNGIVPNPELKDMALRIIDNYQ